MNFSGFQAAGVLLFIVESRAPQTVDPLRRYGLGTPFDLFAPSATVSKQFTAARDDALKHALHDTAK
jgi:hypothetical protein